MPSIAKQRRANRTKLLVKKTQRFGGNSKIKPFNPLCGKLKSNNNLLAKALSLQKQENQLLFTEKIQLTSQLQASRLACNKRDVALTNIQNSAREMLSMLVTMTNHVTNTIMRCQEFSHKDENVLQTSMSSTMRRESTRRLSTKSPARGVVKPMVSGHAITKPTINLRRINLSRINNLIDLSVIEERSPERINNSTINSSRVHNGTFASTNRLGYEGERRRRLPERIPVEYVGVDDDDGGILGRQDTSLSERQSGRHSGNQLRKRSENTLISPIQSPSVTLCDVSKLLQNSQTINVRMLRDLERLENSNDILNTSQGLSHDDDRLMSSFKVSPEKPQKSRKNFSKKITSPKNRKKSLPDQSDTTVNEANNWSEVDDPIEGPSWLLNRSAIDSPNNNTKKDYVSKRKDTKRKVNPPDFQTEIGESSDESMEFTECVNSLKIPSTISQTVSIRNRNGVIRNRNGVDSEIINHVQNNINESTGLDMNDKDDSLSDSDETNDRCTNITVNHSSQFVTDRRNFAVDDDDEEDTIMLQLSKPRQVMRFDINDFRLPILNSPIVAPVELDDSMPEVTTTLQKIPQNNEPTNLYDDNSAYRISSHQSFQLPNIDDASEIGGKKSPPKKKKFNNIRYYGSDSSDSDDTLNSVTKTIKTVKDPSSAKVVLEKLTDTCMKKKSTKSEENSLERIPYQDTMNQRAFDADSFERTTDSNSSTNSFNGTCRPRRQKAPVNLKEPSLIKKLRRNV